MSNLSVSCRLSAACCLRTATVLTTSREARLPDCQVNSDVPSLPTRLHVRAVDPEPSSSTPWVPICNYICHILFQTWATQTHIGYLRLDAPGGNPRAEFIFLATRGTWGCLQAPGVSELFALLQGSLHSKTENLELWGCSACCFFPLSFVFRIYLSDKQEGYEAYLMSVLRQLHGSVSVFCPFRALIKKPKLKGGEKLVIGISKKNICSDRALRVRLPEHV